MKVVGCDVGGTFTDLIYLNEDSDELLLSKVPTTTGDQSAGVINALAAIDCPVKEVGLFVHGTTVTTNAVLERKLARCGLITTKGFRDVLELGRRTRPSGYGMIAEFEPLISRELRFEVEERMTATGEVFRPLDEASLRQAIASLLNAGAESLVIHFLHSYANPAHELRALEIAKELWPNAFVSAGHQIMSEFREYERGVTLSVNGSVQPILDRYLAALQNGLEARGYQRDFLVMQGNGGTVSSRSVSDRAVQTVMSGPASGVIAAAHVAPLAGYKDVITYDMGGTSTDVALIRDGLPVVSSELEIEYAMPISVPLVDVHTIGAGGGSIARVDAAGMLQVGPESAGAYPGPICFGRGGTEPTIADANLVLGRLNPDRLTGVNADISVDLVREQIAQKIGKPLGLDWAEAAEAILHIANDKMAGALRLVSLERGHDPRDFAFFAFGGAGPLHATALAREMGIPTVLIPARPGLTNALGCIVADLRHDFVRTVNRPVPELDSDLVPRIIREQTAEGIALIEAEHVDVEKIECTYTAGIQFKGQSHRLDVSFSNPDIALSELVEKFENAFLQRFRVELTDVTPVLVNIHTAVVGRRQKLNLKSLGRPSRKILDSEKAPRSRQVRFAGQWAETPVHRRSNLEAGATLVGPAIVEQLDCTTVIGPGERVFVDDFANLVISVNN